MTSGSAGSAGSALASSIRKFPCPACGADVVWTPGAASLACPYCGTRQQVEPLGEPVRERLLADGLRQPRDLGWGTARKTVRCTRCSAKETLDPGVAATHCAFCGTPTVVDAPTDTELVRPEGVVPFAVDFHDAVARFRGWVKSLWFRPSDLGTKAAVTNLKGVYVPFWIFDAATHSSWRAEAGFNVRSGRPGSNQSSQIRWEWRQGSLDHRFDDLPMPASRGLHDVHAQGVEPFPTTDLTPYDPRFLSGFLAEEYGLDLEQAWTFAKQRMQSEMHSACAAAVPGDTHRNLEVTTTFSQVAYKGALLPLWITAYTYGGKTYRCLINGATGKVDGAAPLSIPKIVAAIALAALLLFIFSQL